MISHRARCIFVAVPKCASTSVCHWLRTEAHAGATIAPWWWGGVLAERASAVVDALDAFPEYFAFTFVRDPVARFVSLYRDCCRRAERGGGAWECNFTPGTMDEFAILVDALLAAGNAKWGRAARQWFANEGNARLGPNGTKLKDLGWLYLHAQPQAQFIPDLNPDVLLGTRRLRHRPLDFIGRVERFEDDLRQLSRLLGVRVDETPAHNRSGATHDGMAGAAAGNELDARTLARVRKIYEADFANLDALGAGANTAANGGDGTNARVAGDNPFGRWTRRARWHARAAALTAGGAMRQTRLGRRAGRAARTWLRGTPK